VTGNQALVKHWCALFSSRPYDHERIADMRSMLPEMHVLWSFCTFDHMVLQVEFYSLGIYNTNELCGVHILATR
jgi:hypothetical protein